MSGYPGQRKADQAKLARHIEKAIAFVLRAEKADERRRAARNADELIRYTSTNYHQAALDRLLQAVKMAPDEPWLWFQIGWLRLTSRTVGASLDGVIAAFTTALQIDPGNVAAHFAMAYLTRWLGPYSFDGEYTDLGPAPARLATYIEVRSHWHPPVLAEWLYNAGWGFDPGPATSLPSQLAPRLAEYRERVEQAAWNESFGEHVRAAMMSDVRYEFFYASPVELPSAGLTAPYLVTDVMYDQMLEMLFELGASVPEDRRAWYYQRIGISQGEGSYAPRSRWFQEAVRWEGTADLESLVLANYYLSLAYYDSDPQNYIEVCRYASRAYRFLKDLPYNADTFEYVWPLVPWDDNWDPGENLPVVLDFVNEATGLSTLAVQNPNSDWPDSLAALAESAGRFTLRRGDHALAEHYFLRARELNPQRIGPARGLAALYVDRGRWADALQAFRQVALIDPSDRDAIRMIPLLELATANIVDRRDLDQMLHGIAELRAGQDLAMQELVWQHDLLQRAIDLRGRELRLPSGNEEEAYIRLLDQLHNLVQEGSRIQPAAWQAAENRVRTEIGDDFERLAHESQHFLTTAEVFFHTSGDVAELADASLIAVEYAKVVETELRGGLLLPLGQYLNSRDFNGRLYGAQEVRRSGRQSWEQVLSRLSLGAAADLLDKTAEGSENAVVMRYLESRGVERSWVRRLADDIRLVAERYRNGAAHTQALKRAELEEFRALLFNNGLLHRLVMLHPPSATSSGIPTRKRGDPTNE